MPTGTKIATIVLVILLGAAGLYYAFVAPSASNPKSNAARESGTPSAGMTTNGLSSQTPGTLAPMVPSVGAQPSPASTTPAVGALGAGTTGTPTPTGLPAGTGTPPARPQPGFAPGTLGAAGTGKGDMPGTTVSTGGTRPMPTAAPGSTGAGTTVNGFPVNTPPQIGAVPANGIAGGAPSAGGPRPTGVGPTGLVPTGPSPTPISNVPPTEVSGSNAEKTHTVASGETFSSISKKYFGNEKSWRVIAKANPTVDPSALKVGTKLRIPASDKTDTKAGSTTDTKAATKSSTTAGTTSGTASGDTHVVASGETLASIARKYYGNTKYWERLFKENRDVIGNDPAALKVGQKLKVPAKSTVTGGASPAGASVGASIGASGTGGSSLR